MTSQLHKSPGRLLIGINPPRLFLVRLTGMFNKESLMRPRLIGILASLFLLALTTFTVQADFNGVSSTASVSIDAEVETPLFQGGFESTAIAYFSATPDSITEGDSITINWSTVDAESCVPSGDLQEWNSSDITVPSGQTTLAISTAGTYSLNLTCSGGIDGQDFASTEVIVIKSKIDDCTRELNLGTEVDWNQVFRLDWPGPKSEQVTISVPRYSYISLEFNTGQIQDTGLLLNIESTATVGSRLGAISKCPGDFNVTPDCRFRTHTYTGTGILWTTTGTDGYCQLDADTTYYWNTTFTDGVEPSTSECVGTFCYTTLRVWNRDYIE